MGAECNWTPVGGREEEEWEEVGFSFPPIGPRLGVWSLKDTKGEEGRKKDELSRHVRTTSEAYGSFEGSLYLCTYWDRRCDSLLLVFLTLSLPPCHRLTTSHLILFFHCSRPPADCAQCGYSANADRSLLPRPRTFDIGLVAMQKVDLPVTRVALVSPDAQAEEGG